MNTYWLNLNGKSHTFKRWVKRTHLGPYSQSDSPTPKVQNSANRSAICVFGEFRILKRFSVQNIAEKRLRKSYGTDMFRGVGVALDTSTKLLFPCGNLLSWSLVGHLKLTASNIINHLPSTTNTIYHSFICLGLN